MGSEIYSKVHHILKMHKAAESDGQAVHESLKPLWGKSKKLKDLCFALEMLVFKEA